ncbi:MAG TPA: hypothetical protein VLJ19_03335 [Variovorax sp.]|nr:hypothetical protein [Variovorax sp.]
MLLRLGEIAEAPPPTMEALAAEFDFVFERAPNYTERTQDYIATGPAPFIPGFAAGYRYRPARTRPAMWGMPPKDLSQIFDVEFRFPGPWPAPFCISRSDLDALLKRRGWSFRVRVVQPHSLTEEHYSKVSGGYARTARMWPQVGTCITNFYLTYEEGEASSMFDFLQSSTPERKLK